MTPRRETLSIVESPRRERASKHSAVAKSVSLRWRVDARTAAGVLGIPDADRLPLHADASLECRFTLQERAVGAVMFTLRAPGQERIVLELTPPVSATAIERGRVLHIDLHEPSGRRILALSCAGEDRIEYVQTSLFETLGIPAGRYDTATVTIALLNDASEGDASTDAA